MLSGSVYFSRVGFIPSPYFYATIRCGGFLNHVKPVFVRFPRRLMTGFYLITIISDSLG